MRVKTEPEQHAEVDVGPPGAAPGLEGIVSVDETPLQRLWVRPCALLLLCFPQSCCGKAQSLGRGVEVRLAPAGALVGADWKRVGGKE